MSVSDAWLLTISKDLHAAIGKLELIHISPEIPDIIPISDKGEYCQHQVIWQEQHLPLLDMALFLYGGSVKGELSDNPEKLFLCIVSYMSQQENVQRYGAILSSQLPAHIKVDDEQFCELPDSPEKWPMLAISCFSHDTYGIVPILDLPRIFFEDLDDVLANPDQGVDPELQPFD